MLKTTEGKSCNRKKALYVYLLGTIGQIMITCIIVFGLRKIGIELNYATPLGILAIGIGGISSALWGVVVSVNYKKTSVKSILLDFINIRQSFTSYLYAAVFLLLDFGCVLMGGEFQITVWYMPIIIFMKAILFGGIEEIGWRYTFQPILEERANYIFSTIITFLLWSIWHFLYFYIDGSLQQVQAGGFLLGLFTNCFILSALYNKTNSLWICVMTHALINTLSQITSGGNEYVSFVCKGIIVFIAILICTKERRGVLKWNSMK